MKTNALAPYLQSLLRIVAALSFMTHGTQKLFGWPGHVMGGGVVGGGVALFSQFGAAGVLETAGGLLLLIGLFSRPVAFVLAGEMAWAYFQAHFPRAFWPVLSGGEPAALYAFIWLFFAAAGPGPLSFDARGRRSRI
jgi:putative oxidoreductase